MKFSILALFFLISVGVEATTKPHTAQRLEVLCKRAQGEVREGRCYCPLSSFLEKKSVSINPDGMECFHESKCLRLSGRPTAAGCACLLESHIQGQSITVSTSSNAICNADQLCISKAYGQPTDKGCLCSTTGQILNVAAGETCDLKMKLNPSCTTPQQAQNLIQKGLRIVEDICTHNSCRAPQTKSAPPPAIGTIDYFAQKKNLPTTWAGFFDVLMQNPDFKAKIPGVDLITQWNDRRINAEANDLIKKIRPVRYKCENGDGMLYPSYPVQSSKIYNHYLWGQYDHSRIAQTAGSGNEAYCKLKQNGGKNACLRTTEYAVLMASNTFVDSCGNLYRGFWHHGFLRKDESQGDLFSRGHTEFKDPYTQMENAYQTVVGPTYGVPIEDFFMLSEPFAGDEEKAMVARGRALNNGEFKFQCGIFTPTGPY